MAHRLDVDSIHQNVFILLNVCYAAKPFAQQNDLTVGENSYVYGSFYLPWLRSIVSEKLIDISIKMRIIFDMIRSYENEQGEGGEDYYRELKRTDREICEGYNIGSFIDTDEELTIREACNKIIHALDLRFITEKGEEDHVFDEESEQKRDWNYWSGSIDLMGEKGQGSWTVFLHVSEFCRAVEDFLVLLEDHAIWEKAARDDSSYGL